LQSAAAIDPATDLDPELLDRIVAAAQSLGGSNEEPRKKKSRQNGLVTVIISWFTNF
jgi:hypothetical protein